MTPELLAQIGEALYGAEWRLPLSRDLGVHVTTVRRWIAGVRLGPIPAGVVRDLRRLVSEEVEERSVALAALRTALRAIEEEVSDDQG